MKVTLKNLEREVIDTSESVVMLFFHFFLLIDHITTTSIYTTLVYSYSQNWLKVTATSILL